MERGRSPSLLPPRAWQQLRERSTCVTLGTTPLGRWVAIVVDNLIPRPWNGMVTWVWPSSNVMSILHMGWNGEYASSSTATQAVERNGDLGID